MKDLRSRWTINEILAMAPGKHRDRYCTVAEYLVDNSFFDYKPPTPEMEEPAILIEIDGSYITVYAVEGKPWDITIEHLFVEETV